MQKYAAIKKLQAARTRNPGKTQQTTVRKGPRTTSLTFYNPQTAPIHLVQLGPSWYLLGLNCVTELSGSNHGQIYCVFTKKLTNSDWVNIPSDRHGPLYSWLFSERSGKDWHCNVGLLLRLDIHNSVPKLSGIEKTFSPPGWSGHEWTCGSFEEWTIPLIFRLSGPEAHWYDHCWWLRGGALVP